MKKYINQQEMRRANAVDVFTLIRENPGITRRQIAQKTSLSWGAVSNITARLLEERYITARKPTDAAGAGRTPDCLAVNTEEHFVAGLDVNSSGLSGVILNMQEQPVTQLSQPADFGNKDRLLEQVRAFAARLLAGAEGRHILCMGVAMQGPVNPETGVSLMLPQCAGWKDVPLAELLSAELALPVFVEHDPDCILYARSRQDEIQNAILLRVDGGVGMSVMLDGRIMNRLGMFELGHIVVKPEGLPCTCGKRGCLEAYASMRGIQRRAGTAFSELVPKARQGQDEALSLFREAGEALGLAAGNAAFFLHIPDIILCGEMWNFRDLFEEQFRRALEEASPAEPLRCHRIRQESADCGAALIALERSLNTLQI